MGIALGISRDLELDLEQIIGQCIAILGIRGSGKSNTAGVIFEELLANNYPMSIVDIEGEYFGLKQKYEVLVVGTGEGVEIEIDADCAAEIAQVSMEQNVPVVLDLSGFLSDERTEILKEYLGSLWTLAGTLRRPYIIGIEEAHEFIPQGVKNELKEMIARVALRGRKRGLGAIIVSQRSAKVDKDVLSQAGLLLLHRVVHEVDMRVYGELLPWRKSEVKEIIGALETGECIYLNGDTVLPIYVRERTTFHAGFTPSLDAVKTPELKQVSTSIIETIERARNTRKKKTRTEELEARISQLEEKILQKDEKIAQLEEIATTLGYIRVDVGGPGGKAIHVPAEFYDEAGMDRPAPLRTAPPEDRTAPELLRTSRAGTALMEDLDPDRPEESENESALGVIDISAEPEPQRSHLPPAVAEHIQRLVARISKKELLHRRLLVFLIEHAPESYTVDQISAWTRCARELIEDEPPQDFLECGLVTRERRTDGLRYRSSLNSFVAKEFGVYQPDIGQDGLHHVTRILRAQLSAVSVT